LRLAKRLEPVRHLGSPSPPALSKHPAFATRGFALPEHFEHGHGGRAQLDPVQGPVGLATNGSLNF
jgi:hypothetical protein